MIIEFSVGNYRSFKEIVTFSMVASKISSRNKELDESNTFSIVGIDNKLTLLRSAAIYGANASGKSNLIGAIRFMRLFVRDSSKNTQFGEAIDVEPFRLSEETTSEPSFFQMVFIIDGIRYRYGFEINQKQVVSEWLFHVPKSREAKLFVRDENGISISNAFKEGRRIEEQTRDNALFLSVVAQFNGTISRKILGWFRMLRVYFGLGSQRNYGYTISLLENSKRNKDIIQLIRRLDLAINDIQVEKLPVGLPSFPEVTEEMPDEVRAIFKKVQGAVQGAVQELNALSGDDGIIRVRRVNTVHQKYNSEGHPSSLEIFDLEKNESEGTKKLFALTGSLVDVLKNGKILIIDEFDRSLHPLITHAIIKLFNSNEANPKNAQLIITTHDTNMLSNKIFRRDQIWFTEKDKCAATHLYSLLEYKVRNDASFKSDYIQGRYGAIPFIGNLQQLIGEPDA